MALNEVLGAGGITLFVLLSLIQISPVKVNPWSWIAEVLGKAINGEVLTKVDELDASVKKVADDVKQLSDMRDEDAAISARTRILRFNDELLHDTRHTQDHF